MWASRRSSPRCNRSLRIELTRSGGYAGLTTKLGELDTAELPEPDARELEQLVEQADVPALLADAPGPGKGADRFQYHLTIESDSGRRELTLSEDQLPDELKAVVERVRSSGSEGADA